MCQEVDGVLHATGALHERRWVGVLAGAGISIHPRELGLKWLVEQPVALQPKEGVELPFRLSRQRMNCSWQLSDSSGFQHSIVIVSPPRCSAAGPEDHDRGLAVDPKPRQPRK